MFDLPHTVPAAAEAAKAEGLDWRFATVGGDFFDMTGSRVRQLAEFDALFTASGLRRVDVTPAGAFAVIEVQPAT
ncbi:hypothetical protein AB0M61_15140 [Streptomyces sp. NPDC051642]|uniref:hypothetical protein n=1 Tax=Streptomyces sp. NPDC051642 TaxID=3154646 RepID=UPI0034385946